MYQLNNNQTQQISTPSPLFPPYNPSLDVDVAKKRSYNIDYIVNDQSTPEVQQNSVPLPNNNQTQHSIQNQNFDDRQQKHRVNSTPKEGGVCGNVYRYPDVCAEVKHARTPLNTVNQETHSPQLPMPSPNYPVQAEAQLPNNTVVVPTINNNYITTPHATSQCDLKENTTSSTECCQPHSNRINNSKSDLKQTDHLSNLELDETKRNNTVIANLNQVNHPVVTTEYSAKKSTQQTINENNSFTVLNIPNLSFQTPQPSKKPKLSKIDLATLKRKMRRKKRLKREKSATATSDNVTDTSSYYSSSENEGERSFRDLWIRTGPPSKPDLKPEKVEFLKIFGLTTHTEKNCKCFIPYLFICGSSVKITYFIFLYIY